MHFCMALVSNRLQTTFCNFSHFVQSYNRKTVAEDMVSESQSDPTFLKRITQAVKATWVPKFATKANNHSFERSFEDEPKL